MTLYLDPDERMWTMKDLGLHGDVLFTAHSRHTIEGTYLLTDDQIVRLEVLQNHCVVCLSSLSYNKAYDAHYCKVCDEWREEACDDEACDYCSTRPDKPSGSS